ncbi:MAG: hypothetical protein IPJ89_01650 [Candidatus Iainarchaeum archaeon]|uniref:Uncharacterized protein n=1 Tax=Candidatus Iainarchaeum sp. TaxID=3101447 RepID=A0A7T9I2M7_9ARCH|nr:MAG: hypothetical protein IPJ89_01650 [Candidatus Diapherotrites archaeon]
MAFRAEKSPLHPGVYVLAGVAIGSAISFASAGRPAFALLLISILGLIVMLGMWYFREGDVPIGEKKRHHHSLEHVSSALRENAWDAPIEMKRK